MEAGSWELGAASRGRLFIFLRLVPPLVMAAKQWEPDDFVMLRNRVA